MNMKQNNYQKLAAVYTGIALADLIAVFCVLRRLPDPLWFYSIRLPHWFFLGFAFLIVLYFPLVLRRVGKGVNADKNYPMISRAMRFFLPLLLIVLWMMLLSAGPEPQKTAGAAAVCWILALAESIVMILISNELPRLRPNGLLGLRDPWTVRNELCWARTHRFAGKLYVCTGITAAAALLLLKLTGHTELAFTACILLAVSCIILIPPHVYAYYHRNDAE